MTDRLRELAAAPDWLTILEDRDLSVAEFHAMQPKIVRTLRAALAVIEAARKHIPFPSSLHMALAAWDALNTEPKP
jgi:hypothetical protein